MKEINKPIFSVIIPTYNREKLISTAIDSVLSQTFTDFELIIVDDGSQDNTKGVIQKYIERDERVHYIYKKNGGQNSALNAGLNCITGRYVAFLDSDDSWLPTKLEKVFRRFQEDEEIGVVYHQTGIINKGKLQAVNEACLEGYVYKEVLEQEFLASQISLAAKRECMEQIGGYDEKFAQYQDDDMCFLLAKNYKIGVIKEVLSIIGGEANDRMSDDGFKMAQYYLVLIEKYKEDILQFCGDQKLAEMYYRAGEKYSYIGDKEKAKELFVIAKRYDISGKYKKYNFVFVFWKCKMVHYYLKLKHKGYRLYQGMK